MGGAFFVLRAKEIDEEDYFFDALCGGACSEGNGGGQLRYTQEKKGTK